MAAASCYTISRALALAVAGALFRFGGVLVIRCQNGGLSGPQVDASKLIRTRREFAHFRVPDFREPSGEEASGGRFSAASASFVDQEIHPNLFR
jgi:hypothetical protein